MFPVSYEYVPGQKGQDPTEDEMDLEHVPHLTHKINWLFVWFFFFPAFVRVDN